MRTILLTWNPAYSVPGDDWREIADEMVLGEVESPWRVNRDDPPTVGDECYLLRQGSGPRGIVGRGVVVGEAVVEADGKAYSPVLWEGACDPDVPLATEELQRLVPDQQWVPRRSGTPLSHGAAAVADAWSKHVSAHPLPTIWLVRSSVLGSSVRWPSDDPASLPRPGDVVLVEAHGATPSEDVCLWFGEVRRVDRGADGPQVTLADGVESERFEADEATLLDDLRMVVGVRPPGPDVVDIGLRGGSPARPEGTSAQAAARQAGRVLTTIWQRLGQRAFRRALLERDSAVCAVTGPQPEAVLEAAHILPFAVYENHDPDAGLLLRSDIHALFDAGLLVIDPDTATVAIDEEVREYPSYAALHGASLAVRLSPKQVTYLRARTPGPLAGPQPSERARGVRPTSRSEGLPL